MILTLAVIFPLSSAFVIPLLHLYGSRGLRLFLPIMGLGAFVLTLAAAASGFGDYALAFFGGWPARLGVVFVADGLSSVFLALAAFGCGASFLYFYEQMGAGPWRFYVIFFLLQASMNGVLLTGDLFNMFVFYEIFSLAAYLLVSYSLTWQAVEAGLKYLVMGTVGAFFILLGAAYAFIATKTLNMAALAASFPQMPKATLIVIAACMVVGFSLKAGAFPFHFWLPDAHSSAITAVSALLSGVVVKVSIYSLIRVSLLFFGDALPSVFDVITVLGVLSLLGGHLMASRQQDIKRLLAYSTVAQIGYIMIGVGMGTATGVAAAVFHSFNHMLMKSGLFITAGRLAEEIKTRNIQDMKGLYYHRRGMVLAFTVLAAAIVGVPPLNGFMSKWYLVVASVEKRSFLAALALVFGTVISASYYIRVLSVFYTPGEGSSEHESRRPVLAIAALFSACCVVLGLLPFFTPIWELFVEVGSKALNTKDYIAAVLLK